MKIPLNKILILLFAWTVFSSCGDSDRTPSRVYMPDMYYSPAYEADAQAVVAYAKYLDIEDNQVPLFANNHLQTGLVPPRGTVPHTSDSILPTTFTDDIDSYNSSKLLLDSPLKEDTLITSQKGKKLYEMNCAVCHGDAGDGQGSIVKSGAYSGVPNYKDREISVGSVYYVVMYGKNAMGSYASQMKNEDRWRVAEYVMELRNAK